MDRSRTAEIYKPIQGRLDNVETRLRELTDTSFPFLSDLLNHVYGGSGKRIRPAITLLAASFYPHEEQRSEVMATAVELLHIATLIHDDTVDDSDVRRGRATVSSMFGQDLAVLVGDYVFASSATLVCDTGHIGVIRRFAETTMDLALGELREKVGTYDPQQTLDDYYQRIYRKTASLIATSGETGAVLSGAPAEYVASLKEYSTELGMAFQIVDDILDYQGEAEELGKPVGSDLSNGIVTLPAFIAMEQCPQNNAIRACLEDGGKDEALLEEAIDLVRQPGVIDAAYSEAIGRSKVAIAALGKLPDIPAKDALERLVSYVVGRSS